MVQLVASIAFEPFPRKCGCDYVPAALSRGRRYEQFAKHGDSERPWGAASGEVSDCPECLPPIIGRGRRGKRWGRRDANLGWLETETDPSIIIAIWKRRFHALIDDDDDDVASTLDELLLANGTNPSIGGTVFHVKMLVMFWDSLRFKWNNQLGHFSASQPVWSPRSSVRD